MDKYLIKKLNTSELMLLSFLNQYNDTEQMLNENTYKIANGDIDIFGLFCADKIIGEIRVAYKSNDDSFCIPGRRAYLYAFRIQKDFQGNGLGQHLLEYVLNTLRSDGYTEFTVGVKDYNLLAKHIYDKNGFTTVVERKFETYQGDSYEYDLLLKT